MKLRNLVRTAVIMACAPSAYATNGMNLEGYGPIAAGMGGASMAYDNGTAAVVNNPATIGLMGDGHRFDGALGVLGPNVESENSAGSAKSSATAFYMPAVGWTKKQGELAFGVGLFAQGGMGAEYKGGSAVDQSGAAGVNLGTLMGGPANSDSHKQRSELGVGRVIVPLSYNVNDRFTLGGSLDLVWGGMDIQWAMDARNFLGAIDAAKVDQGTTDAGDVLGGFIQPQNVRGSMSGTMLNTFVQNFDTTGFGGTNAGAFNNFYWGYFDFSNGSSFTQQTRGTGLGGKLGFVFKVNDQLNIGGTYHSKTAMSDFKGDVNVTFKVDTTANLPAPYTSVQGAEIKIPGTVKVVDFEWPATYGLGIAFQATSQLLIAADWKRLNWADVMKEFHMVVTADNNLAGPALPFSGTVLDFRYPQKWDDQNVFQIGGAYQATDQWTVRVGYNRASNPVPDKYVNFLFPATVEQHITAGVGFDADKNNSINFSLSYVPEVKVKESSTEAVLANQTSVTPATTITHSQTNWQLMYTYRY